MKKSIFALIIATVFISGMLVTTMPLATAVGIGGQPDTPLVRQLNAIGKILEKVDQRLERVLGVIGPPEEPLDPDILVALEKIRSDASSMVARVDSKLGGTVPPPPTDNG